MVCPWSWPSGTAGCDCIIIIIIDPCLSPAAFLHSLVGGCDRIYCLFFMQGIELVFKHHLGGSQFSDGYVYHILSGLPVHRHCKFYYCRMMSWRFFCFSFWFYWWGFLVWGGLEGTVPNFLLLPLSPSRHFFNRATDEGIENNNPLLIINLLAFIHLYLYNTFVSRNLPFFHIVFFTGHIGLPCLCCPRLLADIHTSSCVATLISFSPRHRHPGLTALTTALPPSPAHPTIVRCSTVSAYTCTIPRVLQPFSGIFLLSFGGTTWALWVTVIVFPLCSRFLAGELYHPSICSRFIFTWGINNALWII